MDNLDRLATAHYEQLKSYYRATPGVILPVVALIESHTLTLLMS